MCRKVLGCSNLKHGRKRYKRNPRNNESKLGVGAVPPRVKSELALSASGPADQLIIDSRYPMITLVWVVYLIGKFVE